ncbi:hypothetical protein [Bradyrhizobium sp. CCGB20]|uniref:hypothetical protein n=1 Tax=Bradyrhizobium sp. CCGB20 TaxID=2949633 RepID=UPI0020B326A7|nr:hypothetical protein [Bradyrhizobium sp. CCGB20]MCP3402852.1 hypothetical protein [Bradyrhizobium sp. CCGB20]
MSSASVEPLEIIDSCFSNHIFKAATSPPNECSFSRGEPDAHVKQAIDYAANKGIEWVVLTSGAHWRIYKVYFGHALERIAAIEKHLGIRNKLAA